jgi:hypothetical protein
MLGRGEIEQSAAQAAAWHLANGLTWQQLTNKTGVRHINGTAEPFFSLQSLQKAQQAAQEANRRVSPYDARDSSPGLVAQFDRR